MRYHNKYSEKSIVVMNASNPKHFTPRPMINNHKVISLMSPIPCYIFDVFLEACVLVREKIDDFEVFLMNMPPSYGELFDGYAEKAKEDIDHSWIHYYDRIPYEKIPEFCVF